MPVHQSDSSMGKITMGKIMSTSVRFTTALFLNVIKEHGAACLIFFLFCFFTGSDVHWEINSLVVT